VKILQSFSTAPHATKDTQKFELGIICTKSHEFKAFYQTVGDGKVGDISEIIPVDDWYYFSWNLEGRSIVVASFIDVQGPIECAMRVTQLVLKFQISIIGMVGIAGGKDHLGEVFVVRSAFAPETGRTRREVTESPPPWTYSIVRSNEPGECYCAARDFNGLLDLFSLSYGVLFKFTVKNGVFASYGEVRNDCSKLLSEDEDLNSYRCSAIEMETFALLKVAQLLKVKVLAAIKGISDVGEEKFERWMEATSRSEIAKQNERELSQVFVEGQTNDELRRAYRQIAGARAAQVMYELIKLWSR